jgi:hypothetical protein
VSIVAPEEIFHEQNQVRRATDSDNFMETEAIHVDFNHVLAIFQYKRHALGRTSPTSVP